MAQLLIKNAKLRGQDELTNIMIENGKFKSIGRNISVTENIETIDAEGNLVMPPLVDPHVHLDAVLVAGLLERKNQTGTLIEAVGIWNDWAKTITKDKIKKNAKRVIDWYIANGVLRVRTHADCTEPTLLTVEALLELKDEMKELIDIQVVAFPQNGIYSDKRYYDLLIRAIDMGVDVIGGAPHLELSREDGVKDVETVYDLAEKYNRFSGLYNDVSAINCRSHCTI